MPENMTTLEMLNEAWNNPGKIFYTDTPSHTMKVKYVDGVFYYSETGPRANGWFNFQSFIMGCQNEKYMWQVYTLDLENKPSRIDQLEAALRDAKATLMNLQPDFGGPVAVQMGAAMERIDKVLRDSP